jgi:hypothetical protein
MGSPCEEDKKKDSPLTLLQAEFLESGEVF